MFPSYTTDMCQYDVNDKLDVPLCRRTPQVSNSEELMASLKRMCSIDHAHVKVSGANTAPASRYTNSYCRNILENTESLLRRSHKTRTGPRRPARLSSELKFQSSTSENRCQWFGHFAGQVQREGICRDVSCRGGKL